MIESSATNDGADVGGPRIAFVIPRYGSGVVGGAETLCRLLAENLVKHDVAADVLTTCAVDHFSWTNELPEGEAREGGVRVRRFPVSARRDNARWFELHAELSTGQRLGYASQLEWMANSVWSDAMLDVIADEREYDWIIAMPYLFGTTYWAGATRPERTCLIACLHDEAHAHQPIVRDLLTGVRGCLTNSAAEGDLLARIAPGARQRLVGVGYDAVRTPSGAEIARFCSRYGIQPGYLLYAGRREAAKNVPALFEDYAAYRDVNGSAPPLALMGAGDLAIPTAIAAHVIELGFVDEGDLAAAFAGASVLVHPSALESLGMVLLEAWLAGTPAIVNARSDVLRWHCEQSGGGLWYRDGAELSVCLDLILGDRDLRQRMASAGRDYTLREFSWRAVRGRLLGALEAWS